LAEIVGAGPRILSALAQLSELWVSSDSLALPMRLREIGHIGETAHQQHGRAGAVALILKRAGAELDPRLAKALVEEQAALFTAVEHTQIFDRFLELEPRPLAYADEHRIDDVARALAIFADLKCPIFSGHSTGVAALAERAAGQLGLGADDIRTLRWAALLHDIGRVAVPSAIWNRRGPLDWAEAEQVRLHAYYTERLLSPVSALRSVAEIAGAAHERLDGAGYPRRGPARLLPPASRILAAADMAFAMSEPRPYREARSPDSIARELCAEVSAGRLDASAATAVLASLGVSARVAPRKVHGLSERELEVCCLIARGKMNKEIAEVLGITFRTVQNHVYHIFEKLGVHSRSGVAVWLIENDLVQ
jgi:DNA-binding CsgD family transcriptional regulator